MTTLADLEDQMKLSLGDEYGQVYSADAIEAALRAALAVYNGARGGTACTISGLNGATETTLPAGDEPGLAAGAAGIAVNFRTAGRLGGLLTGDPAGAPLNEWLKENHRQFFEFLDGVRRQALGASADVPYSAWQGAWEESRYGE